MNRQTLLILNQRRAQAAAGSGESLEALAHTGVVVALSASSALKAVVVSKLVLRDVTSGVTEVDTVQHGGAAASTGVVLHNKEVLLALVAVTSEGNVDVDLVISGIIKEITVHVDAIDDSIGEVQKSRLDVGRHRGGGGSVDLDRDGGVGLIEARLEGQSKGSAGLGGLSSEGDSLGLVLQLIQLVEAAVHHVITMRAHALGAVHIAVLGVADTAADLSVVEAVVSERLLQLSELKVLVGELSGTKGELVNVLAGPVAGAVIGASSALATLSFVTLKALALARLTVAKTLAGALSVSVASVVGGLGHASLGVVNPRELEGADSVGAITSVEGHAQTPIVVAHAKATVAFTMTTARVVTASRNRGHKSKEESSGKFHC
mmetsp:Transcript_19579/g.32952  ORF Transcript_19579/g.32952 Transcript_19579/m.32952 type:complete len:377 (-) Transcript_19579:22-1152(-)